jgi:o-succinylbenzoate---CoA ligase
MPKPLRVVANNATTVLQALRDALDGGDAILPLPDTGVLPDLPDEVATTVALVVQTSGSTGLPKRVALSANALLASAAAAESALGGSGQWLLALPVNYIAGINVLVRSITAATDPVRLTSQHFDPQAFVAAAGALAHPVRYTSLVPAQLSSLLEFAPAVESLRRFDRILIGGQSMPQELRDRALELGISITRTYGSSETSGGCVFDGVPIGETFMRIVDGEVELGGPTLAEGYLGDEERTARSFYSDDAGRWYRTADLGRIDNGVLAVTGRRDDVIVSGGIKVSLAAVERVVRSIPGLSDAVVVRGTDERWGEVPVVFVTTSTELSAVREAVGAELGAAARPAEIVVVGSIPLLASGKPDRSTLERR